MKQTSLEQARTIFTRLIESLQSTDKRQQRSAEGIVRQTVICAARGSKTARLALSQQLACDPKRVMLKLLADWARQKDCLELQRASLICLAIIIRYEDKSARAHKTLQ